jgi:hypothetical protein
LLQRLTSRLHIGHLALQLLHFVTLHPIGRQSIDGFNGLLVRLPLGAEASKLGVPSDGLQALGVYRNLPLGVTLVAAAQNARVNHALVFANTLAALTQSRTVLAAALSASSTDLESSARMVAAAGEEMSMAGIVVVPIPAVKLFSTQTYE